MPTLWGWSLTHKTHSSINVQVNEADPREVCDLFQRNS
jgi:hypothetical protein